MRDGDRPAGARPGPAGGLGAARGRGVGDGGGGGGGGGRGRGGRGGGLRVGMEASDSPMSKEARVRRAYADGFAAAARGEEAAPGCTTSAEGRAFLSGYVAGAQARAGDAGPD